MPRLSPALVPLLLGCYGYKPPAPPSPHDGTPVTASTARTWDAVIDIFASRNIPIRTIERVSGIIATEELSVGPEGRRWADCGTSGGGRLRPDHATYNVLVRGDSATATVKATVRWVGSGEKEGPIECSTTHVWEQDFEYDVKARAEQGGFASAQAYGSPPGEEPSPPAPGPGASPLQPGASAPPAVPASQSASQSPGADQSTQTTRLGSDATVPPAATGDVRSNDELMTSEGFRRAIGDMQRKGFLLGYRETDLAVLDVELSAIALTGPTLEYQLTRLFLAYGATLTGGSPPTTLVLRANGQPIGRYTRQGIHWDAGAGRP
jgi:hypothetical protein